MTEKLTIKNFAGIKELEIEIKKVNILIGPQASGKSVCAKLLFYFKSFVWEILSVTENEQTKRNLDSNYSKKFEEYFPPDSWGKQNFSIKYEISNVFIEVTRTQENKKSRLSLNYSDFFKKELADLRNVLKKSREKNSEKNAKYDSFDRLYLTRRFLMDHLIESLSKSVCRESAFSQLFIPAGRSFFANLQSNIFSFLSSNNALDPFLREFGSTYESIKRVRFRSRSRIEEKDTKDIQDEINRLIEKSLCGKHIHEKGKDFLEVADGRRISVANSSSGQQETLPLTTMLAALPFLSTSTAGQTVYIEEPEAHLFPNAQRNVVELIATVLNYRKEQLQFFITTHSPYVLTALNNLLQAGLLYEESSADIQTQLEKIISRYKALDISDLSAYVLMDGKCSSIVCLENGLIDAQVIDSVSDDLAVEFDKLLSLS
ncbi:AAA family ATPase [Pseudanabaena sp. FACHB-1998]|uniref:AAA family ATPase n=1 Tax=Pseudanabaena sp. FACHB-1998 TaxID=2692858 RepID=UPI0016801F66|nr:AAA family ATPase [Pseudanabaena sp. FACHB-1998]MBD2175735.1 AAA family ATPase [Pseudanabaena sp. FACHB-1998]